MVKTLLRASLVVSILCAFGGAAVLFTENSSASVAPLRFDPEPFVIPAGMVQDEETDIKVDVVNSSDTPARIIGVREFCSHACFYGKGLPVTIPAKGRGQVAIRLKANDIGSFSDQVEFFSDCPSQPKLMLRIEGTIGGGASDEPPIQAFKS